MAKHIFKTQGPPTFAPRQVGHHCIDLLNRTTYISVGITSAADWILLNPTTPSTLKAGVVNAFSFTGSPKKATITFVTPLLVSYSVNVTGVDTRVWNVESITSTGFVINSNANLALTGDVLWEVQQDGEF